MLGVILPLWWVLFRSRGLYEPQRMGSLGREAASVLRATALGVVALVAMLFFARVELEIRAAIALFAVLAAGSVLCFRLLGRVALRALRRRGYNLRYVLLVGAGRLAEEVVDRIQAHPELGLRFRGMLSGRDGAPGRRVRGVPIVGDYAALRATLARDRVDQVLLALPHEDADQLEKVMAELDDVLVPVRLVPDLLPVSSFGASIESLDGLAVIRLRETPLVGGWRVLKRGVDVAVAAAAMLLLAPLTFAIAVGTWRTSGAPVFYTQRRVGLDGRVFRMIKFRTMIRGAEGADGPVWATRDDPRCTAFGRWLRRTHLDELPQLWNVLRGEMSLVGPRPERPVFIERFRAEIPGYMLRHQVKSGLTGWAQVCGWWGDTDLRRRIEHDLYYIRNWSFGLDLRILWMTLWRGWSGRSA
jgi:exopolysaccharide biosynthesis polyprenyl glycosylphosphotransferase